jgi:hypothetical protein
VTSTENALIAALAAAWFSLFFGSLLVGIWKGPDGLPAILTTVKQQHGARLWVNTIVLLLLILVPQAAVIAFALSPGRNADPVGNSILLVEPLIPWGWTWYLLRRASLPRHS